ncbi:MAG: Flp family type IVb pilin [Dethiobacter sp.]|nr:Flp family type IVb pilin [Dethiobacter sp.]
MLTKVHALIWDESGQGMVEYALILAFVAMVALLGLQHVGTVVQALLNKGVDAFSSGPG